MKFKIELKKKVLEPYNKQKKIFDLSILEKTFHLNKKYFIILIFSLIFFLFERKFFIFAAMTLFSSIFSFYHSKVNRTPLDFKMTLFLGLFITRYYGIFYTLIFLILSDIIPALLGGESITASTFFFVSWFFIVNSVVYLFPNVSMIILGPALVLLEAIGSFFINTFFGIPGIMSFFVSILVVIVRTIYFLTIGRLLLIIFSIGGFI